MYGFLSPLDAVFGARLSGARAAVLGAGGAARAVVVALQSRGALVTVTRDGQSNRTHWPQSLEASRLVSGRLRQDRGTCW